MIECTPKPSSAPAVQRPVMRMGTASVGPRTWQDGTVNTLKVSSSVNRRAEKNKQYGRMHDTLPNIRDHLVRQSNTVAFGYVREVRVVVFKLREHLILTNEEVKLLLRAKEATEIMLDNLRKDILLNRQSIEIRHQRPKREKELDEADKILESERCGLEEQKHNLEAHLKATKKQLIYLDQSRKRLARVLDERNQVLDLICHSKASMKHDHILKAQLLGPQSRPNTTTGMMTPKDDNSRVNDILARTANVGDDMKKELLSMQGPGRQDSNLRAGIYTNRTDRGASERPTTPPVDNLGPYTPEAANSIDESRELIDQSRELRKDIATAVENAEREEKRLHSNVNDALTQRLSETVTLMQHLNMGEANNRLSFNRSVRHYDMTDYCRGYTLGPESYRDLRTAEKLDRPIAKVYQRHPGTNLREARELIRGNNNLECSLEKTQKNLALLHLSNIRIKEDQKDKKAAADIDAKIIRLRRQKADHKWVPTEA